MRDCTAAELKKLGFELTDSRTNFLFCRSAAIPGGELYAQLRARGVLVRHFDSPRVADWNRVSVGTRGQMDIFLGAVREILKEAAK